MTLRPLPRSRLDRVLPPLLGERALVALVPIGDDARWSAEAAWGVARAAATGTGGARRAVALVDLCLESPLLHEVKGVDPVPGVAEAFASDVPLTQVAHDIEGVYFLPAGTDIPDPARVRGSARWGRLQAGFRSEGGLLLVCLPAERLVELGAVPDGVIALAPAGVDLGSLPGRALLAARERGSELLGVVRERWSTAQPAVHPSSRTRRVRLAMVATGVGMAFVGGALLATAKESFRATANDTGEAPAAVMASSRVAVTDSASTTASPIPAPPVPVLPARASGAWTLQLAAYGEPGRALAHADQLSAAGVPAWVSPLAPDASGAVWFRVQTGMYPSRDAAAAARRDCWRRGIAARGEGQLLRAPYSLALTHPADQTRLRAAGFAAVRWGAHGTVLIGAFEHPDQARVALSQLGRAGIAATLITRTERTP